MGIEKLLNCEGWRLVSQIDFSSGYEKDMGERDTEIFRTYVQLVGGKFAQGWKIHRNDIQRQAVLGIDIVDPEHNPRDLRKYLGTFLSAIRGGKASHLFGYPVDEILCLEMTSDNSCLHLDVLYSEATKG